jgi:hypothetical protein
VPPAHNVARPSRTSFANQSTQSPQNSFAASWDAVCDDIINNISAARALFSERKVVLRMVVSIDLHNSRHFLMSLSGATIVKSRY